MFKKEGCQFPFPPFTHTANFDLKWATASETPVSASKV